MTVRRRSPIASSRLGIDLPFAVFVFAALAVVPRVSAVAAAPAAGKVFMRLQAQPGQSWTFEQSYDVRIASTLTADGKAPQQVTQNMHQVRSGTVTLLDVRGGTTRVMRVAYDANCGATVEQTGVERQEVQFPLAGQTITLRRTTEGAVESDFRGPLDDQTLIELRAMIEPENRLYPPEPVDTGETWKIGKDALVRNFQLKDGDEGVGICRLDASGVAEGRPVADLAVGISLIKFEQGLIKTEIHLKGGARVDLGTGHTTAGILEGPLQLSGSRRVEQEGRQVTIKVSGEGKVSFKSATRWVAVEPIAEVKAAHAAVAPEPVESAPSSPVMVPRAHLPALPRPVAANVLAAGGAAARAPSAKPVSPRVRAAADASPTPTASVSESTPVIADLPFVGTYRNDTLRIEMTAISTATTGSIRLGAERFPFRGTVEGGVLKGSFTSEGASFPFTAVFEGPVLVFTTERTHYRLSREPSDPVTQR